MNYTDLKTNIQNFLEDDGTELSTSLDVIIQQAEEIIFQRAPNLPCYRAATTGSLVVGQTNYTIATARMIRQVSITSSSNIVYLNHRIDSYLNDYWKNSSTQAQPEMYSTNSASTSGTIIKLAPTPDSTYAYAVDYIAPETGLSSGNTTTWIGNNATNVLLSACLYEASAFLKAPETVSLYKTQFDEAIKLLQEEMKRDYAAEYNGGI
tara:strand:+ start:463 stop:1086 length:624 start_codon:yes stop_codon:yes gene_type:complete